MCRGLVTLPRLRPAFETLECSNRHESVNVNSINSLYCFMDKMSNEFRGWRGIERMIRAYFNNLTNSFRTPFHQLFVPQKLESAAPHKNLAMVVFASYSVQFCIYRVLIRLCLVYVYCQFPRRNPLSNLSLYAQNSPENTSRHTMNNGISI